MTGVQTCALSISHDQTAAMTMGTRIVVMKDGLVQQVDTPANLYTKPCNVFVGGFIGSPQMNFINCTLTQKEDGLYLVFGEDSVKLPEGKASREELKPYIGKEVIAGIRPEDIHDEETYISDPNRADCIVNAYVEVTEMMGAETYLYLTIAGKQFTARVNQRSTAKINDTIKVAFETNKIHIFDKDKIGRASCRERV